MRLVIFTILSLVLLISCNDVKTTTTKSSEKFVEVIDSINIQFDQNITLNEANITSNKFGSSVALDKEYMVVGAEYANGIEVNSGAAYIYKKVDNKYQLISKLLGSDTKTRQYFGHSVDIDNGYVIVGSYYEGTVYKNSYNAVSNDLSRAKMGGVGRVYLFKNGGSDNFTQIAKIEPKDKDKTPYGYFGSSVAVKGDYFVVGARFADANSSVSSSGAVFVFKKDINDNITQIAKLIADDSKKDMQFGYSVDIDNNKIVVGAIRANSSGVVYVFEKDSSDNFVQIAKLIGSSLSNSSFFGWSVVIEGDYIVVGAPGYSGVDESVGAVYVFKYNSELKEYQEIAKIVVEDANRFDRLGFSVAFSNDFIAAGAVGVKVESKYNSGAVYLFKKRADDTFVQIGKIIAKQDGGYFGNAVSMYNLELAIAAELQNVLGNQDAGALYIVDLNQTYNIQGVNH